LTSLHTFPVLRSLLLSSDLLYTAAGAAQPGLATDDSALTRLLPPSLVSLQVTIVGDMWTAKDAGPFLRLVAALFHLAQAVT
jgi:hypothetical protein